MSELKAFEVTRKALFGRTCTEKVYLKSEANKVITELEMKLAAAKLVLRLNEPKALYSNLDTMSRLNHKIDVVERRELHQKYKRCLAMAEWCNSGMVVETFACFGPRSTKEVWREEHKYWDKWRKIWFELAMKFKEINNACL